MNGIIVGAGIGGLSTAISMRKRHIDVKIYEAANRLSPIGAGILVPPNAMIILDRYGLAENVRDAGVCIDSLTVLDSRGKKISETPAYFSKNGTGYQTVAIHRGLLQNVFLDSLPSDTIINGKKCSHVYAGLDGTEVFFEDGTSVSEEFLVGADGLNSRVRKSIFPNEKLRYSGQACWRGISNIKLASTWMAGLFEIWGVGIRFGFVPINSSQVYWYATKLEKEGGVDEEASIKETLLSVYHGFPEIVSEVLSQMDSSSIIRDDIHDLSPMKSWFLKSTVLIGDAAHASTPNLGQGGAQAIEDSWVLAEKIKNCDSVQDAFEQFQALRFSKAQKVVNVSWQIGRVTNMTNKGACKIRDTLFRCAPNFMAKQQSRVMYDVPY